MPIQTLNEIKKKLDELRELRKGSRLSIDQMQQILKELDDLMERVEKQLNGQKKPE